MPSRNSKLIIAIKKYIAEKFDESNWEELTYLAHNGETIIYGHDRLLRSLRFNDPDYDKSVLQVVNELLQSHPDNEKIITDYINLSEWLKANHPKDFEEIYGHLHPILDETDSMAIRNSFELNHHISRIRDSIESDPELAIGSMKELIESVLKLILEDYGEDYEKDDLPKLLKKVQKVLKLDPSEIDEGARGVDLIKRILSSIGQITDGINQLRNLYGSGHGRNRATGITPRHARLVVGTGATLAIFLMETFEARQK